MSLCVLRGIELVEGFHDESIGPQAGHPVDVAGWNSIQPAGQSRLAGVGVLARHSKTAWSIGPTPPAALASLLLSSLVRPRRHSGWSDKAAHHSIGVMLVAAPAAIGRADPALPMAAPPGRRATGGPDNHSLHLHDDLPGPPARATDWPATPRRATTSWALDIQRNHSERPAGGAAERATSCHHELCRALVPLGWRLESATWR